jgi:hypothetical protein
MRGLLRLIVAGIVAGSVVPAQAEDWCGFHQKANSHVRCGFSSLAQCKQALGVKNKKSKNATCRLDPSFAKVKSAVGNG